LIVQGKENGAGEVMVKAKSAGLKEAVLRIKMEESPTIPFILPSNQRLNLDVWRISPVYRTKPNPNQEIPVTDMNSWTITKPGVLQPLSENEYCLFRTQFTPTAAVQKSGTVITFQEVVGEAEVWLDGVMIATKSSVGSANISFQLQPKSGCRTLTLLVKGANAKVGMSGMVIGK
jgi:beta-galactosidase